MRFRMLSLLPGVLLACGADPDPVSDVDDVDAVADADTTSDVAPDVADIAPDSSDLADTSAQDVARNCPTVAPLRLEVGAGALARFTLGGPEHAIAAGPELTTWEVGDALVVRAPWVAGDYLIAVSPASGSAAGGDTGCAAVEVTLTVRPVTVTSATWDPADGPSEREHTFFFIDPDHPDTLVVGSGYGFEPAQFTPLWDLWSWDLAAGGWTSLETRRNGKLQFGVGGRLAADPSGTFPSFLVQGGEGPAADARGEVLAHDASGWRFHDHGTGAPENQLHAFVKIGEHTYLSALGLVAVGDSFSFERGVYRFDTELGWSPLELLDNRRPTGRYGFAYAWDAASMRLIVVSGARTPLAGDPINAASDTWVLQLEGAPDAPTGALWSELATTGEIPRQRNGCWSYDSANQRLFVFGGTADGATAVPGMSVLELDPGHERWVHLEDHFAGPAGAEGAALPPSRASCSAVWDTARSRFVLGFGNSEAGIFRDLWFIGF